MTAPAKRKRAAAAKAPGAGKDGRREEQLFEELARLTDAQGRRAFLARHPSLARAEVVARLAEAVPRQVRVDAQQALAMAEAAELIARKLKSREALAQSLRARGNALYALNQYKAAVGLHEQAVEIFGELGLATEMGRTLSTSIQPLILQGEYDRALAAAARAREIFTSQGDDLRLARLELNVGNIYHRQDRFAEALRSYEQAYEGLLPHRNVEGIAVALGNMAMCLITLNDFPRALETYQRARTYCQEQGLPTLVSLADYNIAYLYYFRGQYSRAIEALRATREACAKPGGDAYIGALCNLDLAEIHLELNLGEDAAEMAEEALNAFRKLGIGYEAAKALSFLAIAQGQQGKVFLAIEMFGEAREMFVREQNRVWPALLDLYRALILFDAGRLPESRRYCVAALEGFRPSALASKTILCRLLLARHALRTGNLDEARRECDQAAAVLSSLDLPAVAFQLHFVRGQIETAAGEPVRAYGSYRRAQEALETLRSSLRGEELKIAFMKNKLEVYESLVDLALAGGTEGAEEAFGYVEQAKSRSLLDLIVRGAPSAPAGAAGKSELVRRVSELREELNWYYHRIEAEQLSPEERTEERLQRLQSQVQAHEGELMRVLRELPASDSEQMALHMPVTLTLAAIQASLPEDAMLVEYFRVGLRLVAFLVTRESLEVVPVAVVSRVRHLLRLLQFQLSWAGPNPGQQVRGFQESHRIASQAHLEDLYEELVAPIRRRLRGAHLIFVPHDVLHYVPFHALYDGERHLIDSFTVSYAPSASIYALCQGRTVETAGSSLIFGIPDQRTPFILEEVQSVAARLPGPELFLGSRADAGTLREKGPKSRFVHIASHGFFRGDNPMFSGIKLGGSHLTLYDFYSLKLPAELVALSACVTGLNVIAVGDEVLGLSRGVFSAGAASLLASLWEVPDQSTADFMKSFYDRYLAAPNKATAVRDAIHAVRAKYPHPVHWAPFVLVGKVFS
jgi:CHAT domain-containing protein